MEDFQELFNNLLKNIKIELDDEFDRNFERKAFFNTAWNATKHPNPLGSLLERTGNLRASLQSEIEDNAITWSSSEPYADIHNEGGSITVTIKMIFFLYKYYLANGGIKDETLKNGKKTKNKSILGKNETLSADAKYWKSLALMKVGSVVKIPQRQFIGDHQMVDDAVINVADDWFNNDIQDYLNEQIKDMLNN
jgi:phage gpG-like protein